MGEHNTLEKSHSMELLEEEANLRELISESVSENTLKTYRGALRRLEAFMGIESGEEVNVGLLLEKLNDVVLARYIATLEAEGKAPRHGSNGYSGGFLRSETQRHKVPG